MPMAVICVSPYLTPSRYSTDREYALMRQLSARIWYICIEVTRVHRPCRTISTQLRMLGILLVNGAATLHV